MSASAHERLVVQMYKDVRWYVSMSGYEAEIASQEQRRLECVDDRELLRQCAWVILTSGFSVAVIDQLFADIGRAFLRWRSVPEIAQYRRDCEKRALTVFGNRQKIHAIGECSEIIATEGAREICEGLTKQGPPYLERFPHIGPITSCHLAKNLGVDVVKPDRHLRRLSHSLGFEEADRLCTLISEGHEDQKSTIDLVLWRFATLRDDYVGVARRLIGVDGRRSVEESTRR